MFMLLLTVGLLLVSCKKETVASQQQAVQQSADGKKPSVDDQAKAFGTQTLSYSAAAGAIEKNFTSVVVNGNTTIQISISNTGTAPANVSIYPSGYEGIITNIPAIPTGSGAYYTYSRSISGWSGYVKVHVSNLSSGSAKGKIIVTSF